MRIVGLSGGIACGKSTVSKLLADDGFVIIDCDVIARQVVEKGRWGWRRVVKSFGEEILTSDGEVDREKLGNIVFEDPHARRKLNAATHLPVALELLQQIIWLWAMCNCVVVIDMPLLFETGTYKWTHPTVLVSCNEETQLHRLMARDRSSQEAALARIKSQMPLAKKAQLADIVVDNSGSMEDLKKQVARLSKRLKQGSIWRAVVLSPISCGLVLVAVMVKLTGSRQ